MCKNKNENNLTYRQIGEKFGLTRDCVRGIFRRWKEKQVEENTDKSNNKIPENNIFNKIQIEKQKLNQEKREIRKFVREQLTFDNILENIQNSIHNLPDMKLPGLKIHNSQNKNELVMIISDLHIGEVSNVEFNNYNINVLFERLEKYFSECVVIAKLNNISNINICFLGDLIQGHDIFKSISAYSDTDPIDQVIKASEVLSNLINDLSNNFSINIYHVWGNHARLSYSLKSTTNFEKLIIKFIEMRLRDNENVKVNQSNGIYAIANVLGYNYLLFHGDNLKDKENAPLRLKEIMDSLGIKISEIIVGHYHHFWSKEIFSNGGNIICSGSLVGGNEHSFKKLQISSTASQLCFVVKEGYGRWGTYNIRLN